MRGNFDPCLNRLWNRLGDAELEDPHLPNSKRLGVSRKTLAAWRGTTQSRVDLNALQKGEASAILHVWFWRGVSADELPSGVDQAVFERAVEIGPKEAVSELQFAIGNYPTGKLNPRDLRKLDAAPAADILTKLRDRHARAA